MEVPFAIHQYHDSDFHLADARAMQFSLAHAIEIIKSIYEEEIKLATFVIYNQPNHDKQNEFFVLLNEVSRILATTNYDWINLLTENEDITVSNRDKTKQYKIKLPNMSAFNDKTSGVNLSTTENAKIALELFQLFYADITTYEETLMNQQAMILSAMKQEEQITNIDLKQSIWHMNIETNGQANKHIDYLDPQVSQFNYNNKDCFEISPLNIMSVDKNGNAVQLDSSNALKTIATHSAAIDAVKLCHGQAFYSALRDPRMAEYQPIQSVRDLNMLNITLQQSYTFITNLIDKMTDLAIDACSGIHTASDLAQMDITYQNYLTELDTLAKGKTFQHLFILSQELSFSAQTKNKGYNLSLQSLNLTSDALALTESAITSQANAQNALGNLLSARKTLYTGLSNTLDLQQRIDEAINADETWVVTDLRSAH